MSVQGDPLAAEAAPDGPAPLPSWVAALAGPAAWPSALSAARAWEVAGWIAILASAAVLRLAALGDLPLGPDEALPAMEAWRLWLGRPPTDLEGAALLTHALVLAFGLLGASDLTARLPTVAAGPPMRPSSAVS